MPGLAIARFSAAYAGLDLFRGWSTPDGAIPSRLFFMLYRAIPSVQADETLRQMASIGLALSGEDDNRARSKLRRLTELAYPEDADG